VAASDGAADQRVLFRWCGESRTLADANAWWRGRGVESVQQRVAVVGLVPVVEPDVVLGIDGETQADRGCRCGVDPDDGLASGDRSRALPDGDTASEHDDLLRSGSAVRVVDRAKVGDQCHRRHRVRWLGARNGGQRGNQQDESPPGDDVGVRASVFTVGVWGHPARHVVTRPWKWESRPRVGTVDRRSKWLGETSQRGNSREACSTGAGL